jgi:DNA/RNA endonuclease YhcR with UshA esterase domain
MLSRDLLRSAIIIAFIVWIASPLAAAQLGMNRKMPQYDPRTEVTIKGTVEEVQKQTMHTPPGRGRMAGMGGTHLKLVTEKGTMDVHLGPAAYLADKKFIVNKGDGVEIRGSLVKIGGNEAVIAREVTKGSEKLVLRDANGIPLWSGSRYR